MATQVVQFKRGTKTALTLRLTSAVDGVLRAGEPAYETDTNKLKVGNGINDYADLPYIGGEGGGLDPRFEISDPVSGQILVYDSTKNKWVNKTTIFTHYSDEIVDGKIYTVAWEVKPTPINTVKGLASNPVDGTTMEVVSTRGTITAAKIVSESDTIKSSDIDKLFS